MALRDYVSANPMARTAADDAEEAERLAEGGRHDGNELGVAFAQTLALVAVAEAILALEVQLDRVVSRIEALEP